MHVEPVKVYCSSSHGYVSSDNVLIKVYFFFTINRTLHIAYALFKGCLGWGPHISILTPYLKCTGPFTPGVKFSSNSVQALQRYYNIQTQRESISPDDIAKSHLEHGTIVVGSINLKHHFWKK